MENPTLTPGPSKATLWIGRVLTALPVLMMLMSAYFKLYPSPQAVEGFQHLGWPMALAGKLAVVEIAVIVIYLIPRTAVLGAILMAAYLGGATATHVRVGDPWFAPVILGIVAWAGIYLRDPHLRALIPLRKPRV